MSASGMGTGVADEDEGRVLAGPASLRTFLGWGKLSRHLVLQGPTTQGDSLKDRVGQP